ncbi:MAG: DNA replication protein, partial [Afipia sp.]|nr:DNA replication protein [Afipia sp.]
MKRQQGRSSGSGTIRQTPGREIDELVDGFRAQHLDLSVRDLMTETGTAQVLVNDSESPLGWLARRKGRDGRPM